LKVDQRMMLVRFDSRFVLPDIMAVMAVLPDFIEEATDIFNVES
jgi:hypothetical protein